MDEKGEIPDNYLNNYSAAAISTPDSLGYLAKTAMTIQRPTFRTKPTKHRVIASFLRVSFGLRVSVSDVLDDSGVHGLLKPIV